MALAVPRNLSRSQILCEAGLPTQYVYFPTGSYVSLITQSPGSPGVEVGMVGREGLVGAHVVLGVLKQPLHAVVQGEGEALRIPVRAFRKLLTDHPALQAMLQKYLYVLMAQLATSAGCQRFHEIGPRLARWLLMSQDRAQSDRFQLTQEFLASMLGVRRVGITVAATGLHERGLIEYHRGAMHVVDRRGLQKAACQCYAADTDSYASMLG
ncbi:MAG: cyclic nucleotide-binding domain (cNMP-BD) protein [Variovorax sp.]|nr:cyclic nucleotide-binding domain (cNMP-BD) protein [Variovorax sp.]